MAKFALCVAFIAMLTLVHSRSMKHTSSLYARSEQKFSVELLKSVYKRYPHQTHIFSPLSVYRVLTLAHLASNGLTEQSLSHALHLDWAFGKSTIYKAYLMESDERHKRNYQTTEFNTVDRLFVNEDTKIEETFQERFGDIIGKLNFIGDAEGSRHHINEFVEHITKNHIREILQPGDITPHTNFVVANAAYFHGKWFSKFNVNQTEWKDFSGTENVGKVEMMHQRGKFMHGYSNKLGASFVEMPYNEQDKSVGLYVFLPSESSNIAEFVEHLSVEVFDEVANYGTESEITIELPKMAFSQRYQFTDVLSDMGFDKMFGGSADFSAISKDAHLTFDDIVHMAKIEIDENGSTAAAATVAMSRMMLYDDEFLCNRPFVFMVYDKHLQQILFTGLYSNPPSSE